MKTSRRISGVALLSVMAIVGITGILAYHIVTMQTLTVSHSGLTLNQEDALLYAKGVEEYVALKLTEDFSGETSGGFDSEVEEWASLIPPFEVPEGYVYLQVVDLTSRFNANSLIDPENVVAQHTLQKLCSELGLDISVAAKLQDWIDEDTNTLPNGAEDWEYALFDTPFRTANQFAADMSEVSFFAPLVKEAMVELEKHITVLPTPTLGINLNTVSPPLLTALIPDASSVHFVEGFCEEERSFDNIQTATSSFPSLAAIEDYLRVKSDFFELKVTVLMGERTRIDTTSTLYRSPTDGTVTVYKRDLSRRHNWTTEDETET
ncbi:MAG: type II secretion system minor pseudopilin GspK [Gammaproteobacteria bacterium]|nr:type II secretion system minor pseudopilin GspK [Gammaproteobacteria bacterium]